MRACGGGAVARSRSATASIEAGDERSKPSGPGVRSGTSTVTPSAAKRAARSLAFFELGPEAKPWR